GLINDMRSIEWTRAKPMIERFCALGLEPAEALPESLPQPVLAVDAEARRATMARLGLEGGRPVAACMPGAEHGTAKRWPYFAELARRLRAEGFDVWLLGGPRDAAEGEAIVAGSGNTAVNLCGRTTLPEAADLLGGVDVAISNDSGLLHVAAATGAPIVGLYGSSTPAYTPPLSDRREILYLALECSPCFARECPLGHFRCLRDMTVDAVLDAALRLANGRAESRAAAPGRWAGRDPAPTTPAAAPRGRAPRRGRARAGARRRPRPARPRARPPGGAAPARRCFRRTRGDVPVPAGRAGAASRHCARAHRLAPRSSRGRPGRAAAVRATRAAPRAPGPRPGGRARCN